MGAVGLGVVVWVMFRCDKTLVTIQSLSKLQLINNVTFMKIACMMIIIKWAVYLTKSEINEQSFIYFDFLWSLDNDRSNINVCISVYVKNHLNWLQHLD